MANGTIELYRSKVSNRSILHMTGRVKNIMERRYGNRVGEYVFPDKTGKKPRGYNNRAVRKAMIRAGLKDFDIHDLRHVAAAKVIKAGASIYEVSKMLGHSSVTMTQRYSFLCETEVSKKVSNLLNDLNERIEASKISHLVEFD